MDDLNPNPSSADFILASRQGSIQHAINSLDDNPDDAARSVELSGATGVPAPVINGDLENFEKQHKAKLVSNLLNSNEYLQSFINKDPMAAKVANDDYANLDAVSAKVSALKPFTTRVHDALNLSNIALPGDPLARFKEGGPLQGSLVKPEDWTKDPLMATIGTIAQTPYLGLMTGAEVALRGVTGIAQTVADMAKNLAAAAGGESLGRDIGAMTEAELMGMSGRHGVHAPEVPGATWLANNRRPPPNVIREVDKFNADHNAAGVDALVEATKDAQSSLTRERAPELFADFIRQHTDAEIGISGDAVAKLYGDKLPDPDDGLLGWVPGIEAKLELAKATGDDIHIPIADWLAKVDPEVMKALHDDIRVRPGGITANEVKLEAERKEAEKAAAPEGTTSGEATPLPDALPTFRAASALEPMLSVGDRKLTLERLAPEPDRPHIDPIFNRQTNFHDFQITDEKGNNVGTLNLSTQKGGKQLYVEMINGVNGLGPRDFGPALMRDLLRQIKEQFPEAETITGHRVSGARDKLGTYEKPSAMPVIKLDNPKGWGEADLANWVRILEGGKWETFSPTLQAYIKPYAERSLEDRKLIDAVNEELNRLAPKKLNVQAADRIQSSGSQGQSEGAVITPNASYIQSRDAYPIVLYSLEGPDPVGSARHEVIHHLRNYGFFKPEEWATLEKAADEGLWIPMLSIADRYPKANRSLLLEEAIADAYKYWEAGDAKWLGAIKPEVQGIFARMKQFFDNLRKRIGELLGKPPSWEDIFEKVSTGEVGSREGTKPIVAGAYDEKLSAPEGDARDYQRANTYGIPVAQFRQYDKLIQKQFAEDLAKAERRAMEEQGRTQTRAWKEERKALRQEVAESIKSRPDVAADLFFGSGELYGKKVPLASVKLDASKLTDAQKAMLPRQYYGDRGLDPDDVANLFGYGSGDTMVSHLAAYNVPKMLAKMSAKDFVSRVTDIETDRQMQLRHGILENNIMDAAKEQALGEVGQDIVHEETLFYASKIGQQPATRSAIKAAVQQLFKETPLSAVDSNRLVAKIGSMGRQIEAFHRAGDWASAFQLAQKREYAMHATAEMVKVEKDIQRFDATTKRMTQRVVPSIDQEYTNFIHDIMIKIGKPVRRSVQDIATEIEAGEYKDLPSFVEGKETFGLREVAVADLLLDPQFRKDYKALSVDEFQAIKTSIDSLIANGRDEKKITKAGEAADLAKVKGKMIEQLQGFKERQYDAKGGRWMGPIPPTPAKYLRSFGIAHIQVENLLNRWDHDDPRGIFQQYIMRDLVDATNSESAKRKVYANRLLELDDKADLKKQVDNAIFKVPGTDQLMKLNRGNLRAILLNAGNKQNFAKMATGYKIEPAALEAWLNAHATKEDWDWAQKMGDMFGDLKKEADTMYRHISGVAPESIPIEPRETPYGTYPGWYYPIIHHAEFEGPSKKLVGKNALEQEGYIRATTANGYTQKRTGYAGPMALDLDQLPGRISQMIHDIEMRPAVLNASKIFYDKDFRSAVFKHFGAEWRDMFVPYLVDVANSANYLPKDQRLGIQASEFIRQNMISTLVGMNPGTVMKHGPTALAQSLHEVGSVNFLKAMKGLFSINERTGENNWQFALSTSEELQRRHQNYIETLGGAGKELQPSGGYAKLRATVQSLAAYPVAFSDLLSAVPTWLAQYDKGTTEGLAHGDAVFEADRAVRRAHGSTAITNRSAVMRMGGLGQWFSSVYGFFNHIMNRQYELLWKSGDALGLVKEGEYKEAMKKAPELTSMLFAYVLAPALIEEMVTPLVSSENESWGKKAAKGIAFTLGASWVGVRDIANGLLNFRDPSAGLLSTAMRTVTDPARDLMKDAPFSKEHAGKLVKDGATLLGTLSGVVPGEAGKAAEFGYGVHVGTERPKGPWGWLVGARYGTLQKHSATFEDWRRGR